MWKLAEQCFDKTGGKAEDATKDINGNEVEDSARVEEQTDNHHATDEKIRLDISCESSARQRIHIKHQALFSLKGMKATTHLKIPSAKKLSPVQGLTVKVQDAAMNCKKSQESSPTTCSEPPTIMDHFPWPPTAYPGFPPHYPYFPFRYSGFLPALPEHFKFREIRDHISAFTAHGALYSPFPYPPSFPPYHFPPRTDKLFGVENRYIENEANIRKSAFDSVQAGQKPTVAENKSIIPEADDINSEQKKLKEPDPAKYQCSGCNKNYSTFSGLSKHKQFHCANEVKKEFNCKYCEKTYVSLGALKMHIRTHTLPCKCKLCGKAFSRPWLLQGHVRTHTGEKPFSCVHCARAFADRSNLRAHLQTHSDIKKYSCKKCSKTFSRMSLLLKHEDNCG